MLKRLKNRLLLIYMLTAGLLLTVIIFILFALNQRQYHENNIKRFEGFVGTIVEEIISENRVSYSWLSRMEAENHLVISIRSNSVPVSFGGSWSPPTDRQFLMDKLYSFTLGGRDGLVFSFYGSRGEQYYGCRIMKESFNGTKEIMVLQQRLYEKDYMAGQFLFFVLFFAAGILALFFISAMIVKKSLLPLKEGLVRQNEFIAAASHELRSPLAVMMTGISTLKIKDAKSEEIIPCIEREGERMAKLIQDMLTIASSDISTWDLHAEEIEMETFFVHIYDSLTQFCRKKSQKLELLLPEEEIPPFWGDRLRMEQILMILADNACSYSPDNSLITIRISGNKKLLTIEVEDHGCGITEEDKKKIFERFYRADHSRNDKRHFGLGLSIAAELAGLHRGKISVRDTKGGGSTFAVELPFRKSNGSQP